jgi:hypothetical protein
MRDNQKRKGNDYQPLGVIPHARGRSNRKSDYHHHIICAESGGAPNYLPLSDNCERVEPFQSIVQHRMFALPLG